MLIVAGSPCVQLTIAGASRGRQGLCGQDSVHFFVVPVVRWAILRVRPDLCVHVVVENAASMLPLHRDAILEALGGLSARTHLLALDSQEWAHMPRHRFYFSTLPVADDGRRPPAAAHAV